MRPAGTRAPGAEGAVALRPKLLGAAALFGAVAAAGVYLAFEPQENLLDRWGYDVVPRQVHQPLWHHVAQLGGPLVVAIGTLLAASWALGRAKLRPNRRVLAVVALPLVAEVLCEAVLKPLVGRRLGGTYCYPSGHVTGAASMLTGFVLAAPRPWRRSLGAVVALVSCLVTVAVVADSQHYPTDAVAALGLVGAVALSVDAATRWLTSRRRSYQPIPS